VQERQEGPLAGGEEKRTSVTYQPSEQASPLLREDEFAKQLRLARYLAASSLPPSRPLEPHLEARTPKEARSVTKAGAKTKAERNSCAIQPSIAANEPEKPQSSVQSVIMETDG
jgi:hypothetical protein